MIRTYFVFTIVMIWSQLCLSASIGDDWTIYGEDDRVEIADAKNVFLKNASSAVAIRIQRKDLAASNLFSWLLFPNVSSAQKKYNLCPEVRFSSQSALGSCSGFLIADKILATAGHCVRSITSCSDYLWAFHYREDFSVQHIPFLLEDDLYSCKRILFQQSPGPKGGADLAIVELDRAVEGASALTLSSDQTPLVFGTQLGMVGYPLGMTQKAVLTSTPHPRVESDSDFFALNLDAFGNNSGSPLINLETGEVEGLLVAGQAPDFDLDLARNCKIEKRCLENECRGETVLKSSAIVRLLPSDSTLAHEPIGR